MLAQKLNRQQLRQANEKAQRLYTEQEVLQITTRAVLREREIAKKESVYQTTNLLFMIFTIALHDVAGFGWKRIGRVLDKALTQFKCLESDHVTVEDLQGMCKDIGVQIDEIVV